MQRLQYPFSHFTTSANSAAATPPTNAVVKVPTFPRKFLACILDDLDPFSHTSRQALITSAGVVQRLAWGIQL